LTSRCWRGDGPAGQSWIGGSVVLRVARRSDRLPNHTERAYRPACARAPSPLPARRVPLQSIGDNQEDNRARSEHQDQLTEGAPGAFSGLRGREPTFASIPSGLRRQQALVGRTEQRG
jgi:hypothetical protein